MDDFIITEWIKPKADDVCVVSFEEMTRVLQAILENYLEK